MSEADKEKIDGGTTEEVVKTEEEKKEEEKKEETPEEKEKREAEEKAAEEEKAKKEAEEKAAQEAKEKAEAEEKERKKKEKEEQKKKEEEERIAKEKQDEIDRIEREYQEEIKERPWMAKEFIQEGITQPDGDPVYEMPPAEWLDNYVAKRQKQEKKDREEGKTVKYERYMAYKDKKGRIPWIQYDKYGHPVLTKEAKKKHSVWENGGEPIPEPDKNGDAYKPACSKLDITMYENWMYRTPNSHRPYPYKKADEDFHDCFVEAWQNKANDTYTKILQEIADHTQEILEHTVQNTTYYVCLMEKKPWYEGTKTTEFKELIDEPFVEDDFEYVKTRAMGWYLEWNINPEWLLIIKSTCQQDDSFIAETEVVKKIIMKHVQEDKHAEISYSKEKITVVMEKRRLAQ